MTMFTPFPETPWFSIDDDQYLVYLLKGYEVKLSDSKTYVNFYLDGNRHREDGPAVIWSSGSVEYRQHNKLHREDGPAVIWHGGYVDYYLNDVEYSEEEYYKKFPIKQ